MPDRDPAQIIPRLEELVKASMNKGRHLVPARLLSAIALLERLREHDSLELSDHMASAGSSGLAKHEGFAKKALNRFGLEPILKVGGRRSSNVREWGQPMLDVIRDASFADASDDARAELIEVAQAIFAAHLRRFQEEEPLMVAVRAGSAEHVINQVLRQAEAKGKTGDVAQYLVGAKLALRFGHDVPILPANKADRKSRSDPTARAGDFEIANAVIEVAVGLPDEKHIAQIAEALANRDCEVWLLTRVDRVATWKNELGVRLTEREASQVVITSVDAFVGQNISELGLFSTSGKAAQLRALFKLYNDKWISQVGTPGIRIEIK